MKRLGHIGAVRKSASDQVGSMTPFHSASNRGRALSARPPETGGRCEKSCLFWCQTSASWPASAFALCKFRVEKKKTVASGGRDAVNKAFEVNVSGRRPQTNAVVSAPWRVLCLCGFLFVRLLVRASSLFVWLPFKGGHREVCERQTGLLASKQT